jgi:hypothetical protein
MNSPLCPFHPEQSDAIMRRWPRIILPTFDLTQVLAGTDKGPAYAGSPHICDFVDGIRLVVTVTQSSTGDEELLQVVLSTTDDCDWVQMTPSIEEWKRLAIDLLLSIEPDGRPRIPERHLITEKGHLILLFAWDRKAEESALFDQQTIDPAPLGRGLEIFTIYRPPNPALREASKAFVVRRLITIEGGTVPGGSWTRATLDAARRIIPGDKVNVGRQFGDDATIEEVWL